jgi:hypothetical protein
MRKVGLRLRAQNRKARSSEIPSYTPTPTPAALGTMPELARLLGLTRWTLASMNLKIFAQIEATHSASRRFWTKLVIRINPKCLLRSK